MADDVFRPTGDDSWFNADDRWVAGAYSLSVDSASFLLSASEAEFFHHRSIAAAGASFTLTFTPASVSVSARVVPCAASAYSLTGAAATLSHSFALTAEGVAFVLTGESAGFTPGRALQAGPGAYALAGASAGFSVSAPGVFSLSASAGALSLTGEEAGFLRALVLPAEETSFACEGASASFAQGWGFEADGGGFTLSALPATFLFCRSVDAGPGAVRLQGAEVSLRWSAWVPPSGVVSVVFASHAPGALLTSRAPAALLTSRSPTAAFEARPTV